MAVFIPVPLNGIESDNNLPSLTYKVDFDAGHIRGRVDELEAVAQAIKKALMTPRFRCLIYDNQYGSEIIQAIIADDATPELVEADMPRLVEDCLLPDGRITEIDDFNYSYEGDKSLISFTAKTIFGDVRIEEVI